MKVSSLLRGIAVLIATLGAIDPRWSRALPVAGSIAIRVLDTPTLDLPAEPDTRRARAVRAAESLRAPFGDAAHVEWVTAGTGSVCPAAGVCVLVADHAIDAPISAGARVAGAVDVGALVSPSLAITTVEASSRVSLHGSAVLRVRLRGEGISGRARIEVRDTGVIVGSAEQVWIGGDTNIPVDVTWVPLAAGPRRVQVSVIGPEGDTSTLDNTADVAVDVSAEPWPVLLAEPEVTWTGTFVRRALEADARFALRSRAQLAPGIAVSRGNTPPLTSASLDETRLVVVAAPDALSGGEVDVLERFVRIRGGSLVLLPDRRPSGPVVRLMPPVAAERREPVPLSIGELRASEIVTFRVEPGSRVIDAVDGQPVVVARALGRGRVVVSGALDAWRYRDGGRFARAWTSVMAAAVAAAPAAMDVSLTPSVAAPRQEVRVTVGRHRMEPFAGALIATATLRCGDAAPAPIRLWPVGQLGTFIGTLMAPAEGECVVEASVADGEEAHGAARLIVVPGIRLIDSTRASLADAMAAHGAPVIRVGQEAELVARVRQLLPDTRALEETHPMRSPWWLLPFAASLSGEWWTRRRTGRR